MNGTAGGSDAVSYKWQVESADGSPVQLSSPTEKLVTVTRPDGRTESFRFTPKPSPPGFKFLNQDVYTLIGDGDNAAS